ncbi:MAG: D-alanyl-D-alanine carboxypeptidase [Ruminococcus sp.]|nr:D-alanyl-D-alanine carboxypeptidase [Ruminococcus sp.]
MFKKLVSIFICILITASIPIVASAKSNVNVSAPSAVLIEAESLKVLSDKNSHDKRACASVTKVMTLLLAMEAVDSKKLKLSDTLSASAHAASMGGSDIWLEEGETMTVDDLIKATAVASANDAAVVLAEAISGSEDSFVSEMNKKAKLLGMNDTTFKNCNGLDEDGHLTSAYDVALMSAELIKHKKIFDYTSIWLDDLRGGETQIVNTNKLLKTYKGITGLKTGTTDDAGCCMSASAERDGLSLIAVVLGCDTGTARFADSAALLDYGFANYTVEKLTLPKKATADVKVKGGMGDTLFLRCENPGSMIVSRSSGEKLITECKVKKELQAPIKAGDTIGEVNYYSGKELLKSCKITAKNTIEKMTFSSVMSAVCRALIAL